SLSGLWLSSSCCYSRHPRGRIGSSTGCSEEPGTRMRNQLRRVVVLMALVAIATWDRSVVHPHAVEAATTATLTDLSGVNDLKTLFNQDKGKIRLVLLVSPT